MKLIAECYANRCFALELRNYIQNIMKNSKIYIGHNYRLGRDKILKLIKKYAAQTDDLLIAIIDYEKGVSRKYIDFQFKISKIGESILFGEHKHKRNIIAIIFDPNIEEALLCKYYPILCRNINYYERIKSDKACEVLKEYLKRKPIGKILLMIAKMIIRYCYE